MIIYKEFGSELLDDIIKVYQENDWQAYLKDNDKLKRAFDNSLSILGAFDDDKLVGFIRCIGDKEYVLYIQDLVIRPKYHRQGIGKELVRRISELYPNCRHFFLTTDAKDEKANAFYQAIGLTKEFNGWPINHYFRTGVK